MSVYRRGAIYWWHRVARLGNVSSHTIRLRVSLKTSDKAEARRRASLLEVEMDMVAVKFPASEGSISSDQLRIMFKEAFEYKLDQIARIQGRPPFDDKEHRRYNAAYSRIFGAIARTGMAINNPATLALALDDEQIGQTERELIEQLAALHCTKTQAVDVHLFNPKTLEKGVKTVRRPLSTSNLPVAPRHVLQYLANAGLDDTAENRKVALSVAAAAYGRACVEANAQLGVTTDGADFVIPPTLKMQMGLKAPDDLSIPNAEPIAAIVTTSDIADVSPQQTLERANDLARLPAQPNQPTVQPQAQSALRTPRATDLRISEVCEKALEENKRSGNWADSAMRNARVITNIFIEENGDLRMSEIVRTHLLAIDARLKKLPQVWGKSREDRAGGLSHVFRRGEALAVAWTADPIKAERDGIDKVGLAPGTYNRHINTLKQILDFVEVLAEIDTGQTYVQPSVSFQRLHEVDSRPKNKRKPLPTITEIQTLLSGPLFTGSKSETERFMPGHCVFHDSGYWVPLKLVLYGARSNELCQMPLANVILDAQVPFFRIRSSVHQTIKTSASDRDLPIAPLLLQLGFGDYVKALRAREEFWLYPELNTTNMPARKVFRSRFFVPLIAHHFPNGTSSAIDDKDIDTQSLRKFATTYLRKSMPKIELGVRQSYFGHEKKTTLEINYEDDYDVDELLPCILHMETLITHLSPFQLRLSLP
jgi:hypothetical protein